MRIPGRLLLGSFLQALASLGLSGVAFAAPPAAHAFAIEADKTPHTLIAGDDVTVRLSLANTGSDTWVSGHEFNLSYHWWTVFGNEFERDGLRAALPQTVRPSERVEVVGRLHAPDRPGLYFLQWDIVEEDVQWFSERDPRPPARILVAVAPTWIALWLPVSALLAVAGVFSILWRQKQGGVPANTTLALSGPVLSIADAGWCAASLMSKQLFLAFETGLHLTPHDLLTCGIVALTVPALFTAFLGNRRRAWVSWSIAAGGTSIVAADVLYFRYFKDVISAPALLASGQIGRLGGSVMSLVAARDIWLVLDLLIAAPLVVMVSRLDIRSHTRRIQQVMALGCVLAAAGAWYSERGMKRSETNTSPQVVRNLSQVKVMGVFAYHAYDTWTHWRAEMLRPSLDDSHLVDIANWFASRAIRRTGQGPFFGIARGQNLIVIQVESLQQFVVGLRINGQEVTPNMNRWRDQSLWFSNVSDQTSEGRTSDCEFLSLASLLPLEHGAVAFRYPSGHYVALPTTLAARGYSTLSAVAFDANFWNRRVTHPGYGFEQSLFGSSFAPGVQVGWGLNDRDFLAQMVPRLTALPRPFMAWLITLSLHHPFASFPAELRRLKLGAWENTSFGNYLQAMSVFDQALGEFLTQLDHQTLLTDTVVVVLGDHDAGFEWQSSIAAAVGFPHHVLDWYLQDRVPLIVHVPAGDVLRGQRTITAGQSDVAPTLLALLGIEPAPLAYMGRNLLGNPGNAPIPRPYGDWIDDQHLFVSGNGAPGRMTCYDIARRAETPSDQCNKGTAAATEAVNISRLVVTYGLQEQLSRSDTLARWSTPTQPVSVKAGE